MYKQRRSLDQNRLNKILRPYAFLSPTFIFLLFLLVIPIILVISYSFYDNVIVVKAPKFVGFDNYKKLFTDSDFFKAVEVTIYFVGFSVFGHLLLGMGFAHLLNSKSLKNSVRTAARIIYILPWVFTASVVAILWKLMLQPQGIINYILAGLGIADPQTGWFSSRSLALPAITFVNIWAGYPFFMISILAGLQGIPQDIYESAAIDGATGFKKFLYITIPQLRPILTSLILLDIVWTLQSFAVIWMLTGGGPVNSTQTLSIFIYRFAFNSGNYSYASTAAVVVLIVCSIMAVIYSHQQQKAREA